MVGDSDADDIEGAARSGCRRSCSTATGGTRAPGRLATSAELPAALGL